LTNTTGKRLVQKNAVAQPLGHFDATSARRFLRARFVVANAGENIRAMRRCLAVRFLLPEQQAIAAGLNTE
jgi:hypothetical protein